MLSCTWVRKACLACMHNWSSHQMKDGCAIVHNEKRKKNKMFPFGRTLMWKEMDCHLSQMHCYGCLVPHVKPPWRLPKWIHHDQKVKGENLEIGRHIKSYAEDLNTYLIKKSAHWLGHVWIWLHVFPHSVPVCPQSLNYKMSNKGKDSVSHFAHHLSFFMLWYRNNNTLWHLLYPQSNQRYFWKQIKAH